MLAYLHGLKFGVRLRALRTVLTRDVQRVPQGQGLVEKKKVKKKWVHYYFIFLQQVTYGHQACIYLIYIKIDFMQC